VTSAGAERERRSGAGHDDADVPDRDEPDRDERGRER
jgi:hypothetical protein